MLNIAVVAFPFCVVVFVDMFTKPSFSLPSMAVIARITHSFSIMFSVVVWTFIHSIMLITKHRVLVVVCFGYYVPIFIEVFAKVRNGIRHHLVLNVFVYGVVKANRLDDVLKEIWLNKHFAELCSCSIVCHTEHSTPSNCCCFAEYGRRAIREMRLHPVFLASHSCFPKVI